jgi:hypothetical protein
LGSKRDGDFSAHRDLVIWGAIDDPGKNDSKRPKEREQTSTAGAFNEERAISQGPWGTGAREKYTFD